MTVAWVTSIERKAGDGKIQPTQLTAHVKVFVPKDGSPIIQIDTYGSSVPRNTWEAKPDTSIRTRDGFSTV
jgi:hypothetical protein